MNLKFMVSGFVTHCLQMDSIQFCFKETKDVDKKINELEELQDDLISQIWGKENDHHCKLLQDIVENSFELARRILVMRKISIRNGEE